MSDLQKINDSIGQTLQAFSPCYRESMIKHMRESEAPNNWFPLTFVRAVEPAAFSIDQAQLLAPYMARNQHKEQYDALAEAGCLEALGDDTYRLTNKGRRIVEGFFELAHEQLAGVDVLPAADMDRLASLLQRIVTATLESEEPALKPSLKASRWTDPGPDAAAAARVDQYVTDLVRYRDDAHIGAWQSIGVDGRTWETLTLLWRDEANSAPTVAVRLSGRGFDEADYEEAMNTLAEKNWIAANGDGYQITDAGKQLRQEAEENTDRLYYIGWAALNEEELETLGDLLTRLNDKLRDGARRQCWAEARLMARALFPITRGAVAEAFNNYFDSPRAFFPTLMAYGARPKSFSAAEYGRRFPYTKPERALALLGEAEASGCLAQDGESFNLTSKGQEAIVNVNDIFYKALAALDPLPEEESAELDGLLNRLVEAVLAADEPQGKWSLTNIHNCHPDKEYGPLPAIDQKMDDLNAFRDDVHMAAWQSHDVSARDWDALTLVWRGEASTAEEIAEEFQFKGYSAAEYAESLNALVSIGWLKETDEQFAITDNGRQVRQEAEDATDSYFFEPWQVLNDDQLLRLHTLLVQMKLGLQALAEEEEAVSAGA